MDAVSSYLASFNMVVLIYNLSDDIVNEFAGYLWKASHDGNTTQKLLVLCTGDIYDLFGDKIADGYYVLEKLSEDQARNMNELYHTWEFSDRFRLLSDESCCGSLLNYAKTGILSYAEAFEAFLKAGA
jgi:hypothetical protein